MMADFNHDAFPRRTCERGPETVYVGDAQVCLG